MAVCFIFHVALYPLRCADPLEACWTDFLWHTFVTGGERKGKIICPKRIISWKEKVWTLCLYYVPRPGVTSNTLVTLQFLWEALDSPGPLPLKSGGEYLASFQKALKSWCLAYSWLAFCLPLIALVQDQSYKRFLLRFCRCLEILRAKVFCKYWIGGGHGVQKIGK